MGSVAQAVVEFDEAVQAPWRPPLAAAPGRRAPLRVVPDGRRHPGPRAGAGRAPAGASSRGRRPVGAQDRRIAPAGPRRGRPSPACAPGVRTAPGVRLTRRARRLGVVLGLAVGVAVGSWVGSAVAGEGGGLRLAGESSVVVQQGDTLWSLAAAVAGQGDDVREVIAEIRQLNELADASLVPGQVLVLP